MPCLPSKDLCGRWRTHTDVSGKLKMAEGVQLFTNGLPQISARLLWRLEGLREPERKVA